MSTPSHLHPSSTLHQAVAARSISSAASITTRDRDQLDPDPTGNSAETTLADYDINTSTIVRTAVVSGVIVLVLTLVVLFFRVTSWIRYHQRLRRQAALHQLLQNDQRANAYEIAAWADEPGLAPGRGEKRMMTEKKKRGKKATRRGAANAYGVSEWEGVAQ